MMTDAQLAQADRLLVGIDSISEAVERLNVMAAGIGVPPIAIRFAPSPLIYGENHFSAYVNGKIADEYKRRLLEQIGKERARREEAREAVAA